MEEELSGAGISNLFAVGELMLQHRVSYFYTSGVDTLVPRRDYESISTSPGWKRTRASLHLPLKCFAGFVC